MEIALLDADVRLGNGFCLPAGPLREPPGRLDTVNYVLYRGGDDPDSGVQYDVDALVNVRTGDRVTPSPGRLGAQVTAVAGIGQPGQFFTALQTLGFTLRQRVFPDHHVFTAADFRGLEDQPIIMTEKDAVKCGDIAGSNAWYLSIRARLPLSVVTAVTQLAKH
jgi:tetraacyldisaccharide 4'-kinase